MTNIVFSSDIVRDDSSSVADSTEGSLLEENNGVPERGIQNRFEAKRVLFSAIGKVYSSITRSVYYTGSSSGVKIETSGIEVGEDGQISDNEVEEKSKSSRFRSNPRPGNVPNHVDAELVAVGWPSWLILVAREALMGWVPRRADSFEKLDKIGQGKHSNVYKGRDLLTGKIVALKKVRFDILEPESVKFMAREIVVLRRLDHPNVIKLEGLVTSRMSSSLYLIFEYIEHDMAGLAANTNIKLTEPQIKCYMRQLLLGLEHCHNRQVLHRDLKGSDLRLDNGVLKVADFGLASFFDPYHKYPMTSRVVSLWYRPLELLLGATEYGVAVDLWCVGCILAELYYGRPIMSGRTEVEQLHKIFRLCGSPSENYWKNSKLPYASIFKPQYPYPRCIAETFKDFPPPVLSLIETLLAIDPAERQTAVAALQSEFFTTKPYACEPSSLPQYPPSKVMDVELRDEEAKRLRAAGGKTNDGVNRTRPHDRAVKAVPAPDANSELHANIDDDAPKVSRGADLSNLSSSLAARSVFVDGRREKSGPSQSEMPTSVGMTPGSLSGVFDSLRKQEHRHQVRGLSGSRQRDDGQSGNKDRMMQGYGSKGNKVYYSGPLAVPSGNVDQILKDHDRQIQEAVRRARIDQAKIRKGQGDGNQILDYSIYSSGHGAL